MKKLWQKNENKLDPFIEAFETKDDLLMDKKLIKYDCLASIAHAKMFNKIGLLSKNELGKLEEGCEFNVNASAGFTEIYTLQMKLANQIKGIK